MLVCLGSGRAETLGKKHVRSLAPRQGGAVCQCLCRCSASCSLCTDKFPYQLVPGQLPQFIYSTITKHHMMASRHENHTYLFFMISCVYTCVPDILCMEQMCMHMCEHGCGSQKATSGPFPRSPAPLIFFVVCLLWFWGQVSH